MKPSRVAILLCSLTACGGGPLGKLLGNSGAPPPSVPAEAKAPVAATVGHTSLADACDELRRKSGATLANRTEWAILGCDQENPGAAYVGFMLDQQSAPSQLQRAGYVWICLQPEQFANRPNVQELALPYATCGTDARALDRKQLDAELASRGFAKAIVDKAHERFDKVVALNATLLAAFHAEGPSWTKTFVEAPGKGFAARTALFAQHAAVLKDVRAFDEVYRAGKRSAAAGCGERFGKTLLTFLADKPRQSREQIRASMQLGPAPYLLGALAACDFLEGRLGLALQRYTLASLGRSQFGPRAAAHYAAIEALLTVRKDETRFPIEPAEGYWFPLPSPGYDNYVKGHLGQALTSQTQFLPPESAETAIISDVKPNGDHVVVSFEKVTRKVREQECRPTNRIESIGANGHVFYYEECRYTGKILTIVQKEPEVAIRKEVALGLERGRVLLFEVDHKSSLGGPKEAYPFMVATDPELEKPVAYHGFAIGR
jgi:hypothetical protein